MQAIGYSDPTSIRGMSSRETRHSHSLLPLQRLPLNLTANPPGFGRLDSQQTSTSLKLSSLSAFLRLKRPFSPLTRRLEGKAFSSRSSVRRVWLPSLRLQHFSPTKPFSVSNTLRLRSSELFSFLMVRFPFSGKRSTLTLLYKIPSDFVSAPQWFYPTRKAVPLYASPIRYTGAGPHALLSISTF